MPPRTSGLVLAAGGSQRLGRPKQLLPFGSATLLDHTLATARACGFGQLLCVLGGGAEDVRTAVDLSGAEVVVNRRFGAGCSASNAPAHPPPGPAAQGPVVMLGAPPG